MRTKCRTHLAYPNFIIMLVSRMKFDNVGLALQTRQETDFLNIGTALLDCAVWGMLNSDLL